MFVWNGYGQEYKITSPALNGVIGEFFTPLFGEKLKNEYKTLTNIETKVFTFGKKKKFVVVNVHNPHFMIQNYLPLCFVLKFIGASLLIKKGLEKTRKTQMIMMVVIVMLIIANIILY